MTCKSNHILQCFQYRHARFFYLTKKKFKNKKRKKEGREEEEENEIFWLFA